MIAGTLIELTRNAVDVWASADINSLDHVGLLHEGDWLVFLEVESMPNEDYERDEDCCPLLKVVTRFGVGFINSSEVPEYSPGGKIGS
jgi:hypothetical protein